VFIVTTEGRAVAQATVTVYSADFSVMVTGETDAEGRINLVLPQDVTVPLYYTVVGQDLDALIDQPLN